MPRALQPVTMARLFFLLLCLAPWAVRLLFVQAGIAPLQGATLERLSLDDLVQQSTAIVRGRVVGSYTGFRGSVIYTHWKVQVVERWKGSTAAAVEVLIPGGVNGAYRQSVTGAPRLIEGKEYLLFLWTSKTGPTFLTGLTQGLFDLPNNDAGEVMATRAASSEIMLERGTWQPVKDEPVEMRLREMSSRIVSAMSKAK